MGKPIGNCFTARYAGYSNVLQSKVYVQSCEGGAGEPITITALWDTGASGSLIRPEVVSKLNLKILSMTRMSTPSGKDMLTNIYAVNLYLPNRIVLPDVRVLEGIPSNCDILIGMDVIGLGDFAVSNYNGKTTFSFRMPSCAEIDFTEHSYQSPVTSPTKPGRNDTCPCGSGKKYKKCCGTENQ